MAHFALIDKNNEVIFVTPVANNKITLNGIELEEKGIDFLFNTIKIKELEQNIIERQEIEGVMQDVVVGTIKPYESAVTARQTSFNNNFRNKYAGIGDEWDEENNLFRSPKPFESWVLNKEKTAYEAPTPMPSEGLWIWNEEELKWIETQAI